MREPKLNDLIEFICEVQPELDSTAAAQMLAYEDIYEGVAAQWKYYREYQQALLEFHLCCQEVEALKQ